MTDRDLAAALVHAKTIEQQTRSYWDALGPTTPHTLPERDASLVALRKVTELRVVLEQWMAARACRAALQ